MAPHPHTRVPAPGPLAGRVDHATRSWRGIPFGHVPAHEGRWRAPQTIPTWEDERTAHDYGPVAAQPVYSWQETVIGEEDCLTLDIVRPDTDDVLPVVVYFHGGSFLIGASHQEILRGHRFVTDLQVVYVAVNFRLGVFGYLDTTSLDKPSGMGGEASDNDAAIANPALADQILALNWVKDNIHLFGGDPTNVTIMGESAGGAAVTSLLASPPARGLFHKAIAQSAPAATFHHPAQSAYWARQLLNALNLPADTTLEQLRTIPTAQLVKAGQSMLWRNPSFSQLNSCYGPALDDTLMPAHPIDAAEAGTTHPVPLIIGTNNDEASITKLLYLRRQPRSRRALTILNNFDPTHAPHVLAAYAGARTRADFARLLTDAVFWAPSVRYAQAHAAAGNLVWMYRYDFANVVMRRIGMGAMHSMELAALFNDPLASRISPVHRFGAQESMGEVTTTMQHHWGSFIHHGHPGDDWPAYHPNRGRTTLIINHPAHLEHDPRGLLRAAWQPYDMTLWGRGEDPAHHFGDDDAPTPDLGALRPSLEHARAANPHPEDVPTHGAATPSASTTDTADGAAQDTTAGTSAGNAQDSAQDSPRSPRMSRRIRRNTPRKRQKRTRKTPHTTSAPTTQTPASAQVSGKGSATSALTPKGKLKSKLKPAKPKKTTTPRKPTEPRTTREKKTTLGRTITRAKKFSFRAPRPN